MKLSYSFTYQSKSIPGLKFNLEGEVNQINVLAIGSLVLIDNLIGSKSDKSTLDKKPII